MTLLEATAAGYAAFLLCLGLWEARKLLHERQRARGIEAIWRKRD